MADATLRSMTPFERHVMMKGTGWTVDPMAPNLFPTLEPGYYMGNTDPVPRLRIPALKLHDAGAGFRINPTSGTSAFGTSTVWPSALAMAASWDDAMTARVAAAIGEEFKAKDANVILGPAVQVHRVGSNGRNFEYLSGEDPYLGARLAAAYVPAVQSQGVIACAKHWIFNEQETNRNDESSVVDEQTAWEIYYPPFEAAVKAGVGSFMCGYNKVNGTWLCENEKVLQVDLKGKMGFRGFVMSDWFAIHSSSWDKGLDQCMPGVEPWFQHESLECSEAQIGCDTAWSAIAQKPRGKLMLEAGIKKVREYLKIPEQPDLRNKTDPPGQARNPKALEPARRILTAIYRNRVDESPGCVPGPDCVANLVSDVTSGAHRTIAREAATASVVLLKNEGGHLPLDRDKVKTVALVGTIDTTSIHEAGGMPPADLYSGGGSGHVGANALGMRTIKQGFEFRARKEKVEVLSKNTVGDATPGGGILPAIMDLVRKSDVAVVVGATTASEGVDRNSLYLDFGTNDIIQSVAAEKPTIVVMITPGTVLMPWRDHPNVTAIVNLFLGGEETSDAISAVLFGDHSPTGKLPIMLPRDDRGAVWPNPQPTVIYTEGMYGSYRSDNAAELSAYPFGHGLSFTTFTYGVPQELPVSECERGAKFYAWKDVSPLAACVAVAIKNTGMRDGAEVAQAYAEFPPAAGMPKRLLKGFHKTEPLEAGGEERALFGLTERDVSTYRIDKAAWVMQEELTLHIGSSSLDIRQSLHLALSADAKQKAKETKPTQQKTKKSPNVKTETVEQAKSEDAKKTGTSGGEL